MADVSIGVTWSSRDLHVSVDTKTSDLVKQIESALSGESGILWLTDSDGKLVGVPADKIAWIEVDPDGGDRKVGFSV